MTELTHHRMTVGKIYAGLLIAENWKAFKANKSSGGGRGVSYTIDFQDNTNLPCLFMIKISIINQMSLYIKFNLRMLVVWLDTLI